LKLLAEQPDVSQRQLADALGVSLGKANYCVRALLERGWIKARNFKNSKKKLAYRYLLTPSGIDAKARITARFLKRKIGEYEALKAEIAQLTMEVEQGRSVGARAPVRRDRGAERPSHKD
jgi:EPS-associated MarR family transcriptional regulator